MLPALCNIPSQGVIIESMTIHHPERRLLVVHNPNSSGASSVKKEVFARLDDESVRYQTITTRFADTEDNIADIASQLCDGDMVISAAGDGTAAQVSSAVLDSGADAEIGFLPFGNFNDLASSHMGPKDSVLDVIQAQAVDVIPLSVALDGELWRYTPSYMTIGWTALAASKFNAKDLRKKLRFTPRALRIAVSMAQLADSYFRDRPEDLPPFTTTERPTLSGQPMTDILAINSPHVAQLVRLQEKFYDGLEFGYKEIHMAQFLHNVPFGLQALTSGAPLDIVKNELSIHFDQPVHNLPVQTEGEIDHVDMQDIAITKNPETVLRVLHTNRAG